MNNTDNTINSLVGQTLTKVERQIDGRDNDELVFTLQSGKKCRLYHSQDCCELVKIEDICGDLNDLVGLPLIQAEESSNQDTAGDGYGSITWTFYRFATSKGFVTIRWLGESNGYYSESVDFEYLD